MALTAAAPLPRTLTTDTLIIPMAGGATMFVGGLVCSNMAGYATKADDKPGFVFEGYAMGACDANGVTISLVDSIIDNSDGDDGDIYILVRRRGRVRVNCSDALTQSAMSCLLYVVDDNTVAALAATVVNDVVCGRLEKVLSTGVLEMSIDCYTHCAPKDWSQNVTTTVAPTTTTTSAL